MKTLAYILIIAGLIFTSGMIYIIFTVESSSDIIIGWLFLGPLPLIMGSFLLGKFKSIPFLDLFRKK